MSCYSPSTGRSLRKILEPLARQAQISQEWLKHGRNLWWDWENGDDANGGTSPDDAVLTWERLTELIEGQPSPDSQDWIMVVPGSEGKDDGGLHVRWDYDETAYQTRELVIEDREADPFVVLEP